MLELTWGLTRGHVAYCLRNMYPEYRHPVFGGGSNALVCDDLGINRLRYVVSINLRRH